MSSATAVAATAMDGTPRRASVSKPKVPRLYHKKSRNGCQRCRARRVKCDEIRPICSSCNRHVVSCIYDNPADAKKAAPKHSRNTSLQSTGTVSADDDHKKRPGSRAKQPAAPPSSPDPSHQTRLNEHLDIPESKNRRLLELRLLQNYVTNASDSFPASQDAFISQAWSVEVPKLAFKFENLLYAMFSISALQMVRAEPHNPELRVARQYYLDLTLRTHRKAVEMLSTENADAVCFGSMLILVDSFATMGERDMTTWTPPMAWLQMARGVGSVFKVALDYIDDYHASKIMLLMHAPPLFSNSVVFSEENRRDLLGLLSQDIFPVSPGASSEPWSVETKGTYELTLSYIGSIQRAIIEEEHVFAVCRRLMAFALLVPKEFIQFVEEKRPRALVVLAHFFALAAKLECVWWIGDTARREIQGIHDSLPPQWQQQMRWPLVAAGLSMP